MKSRGMTKETEKLLSEALKGRELYRYGKITRAQAFELVTPYVNHANEKAKEIAKRLGMRPRGKITVIGFLR